MTKHLVDPENDPVTNEHPALWDMVIFDTESLITEKTMMEVEVDSKVKQLLMIDMHDRDLFGAKKYGTRLQPFNDRDPLVDAYQELLDALVYIKQEVYESDGTCKCFYHEALDLCFKMRKRILETRKV